MFGKAAIKELRQFLKKDFLTTSKKSLDNPFKKFLGPKLGSPFRRQKCTEHFFALWLEAKDET